MLSKQAQSIPRRWATRSARRCVVVRASSESRQATVSFSCHCPVSFGTMLVVVGSSAQLGDWDLSKALSLSWNEGDVWTADAQLPAGAEQEYKYVKRKKGNDDWMKGYNFKVLLPEDGLTAECKDSWDKGKHYVDITSLIGPPPAVEEPPPAPQPPTMEEAKPMLEEETGSTTLIPETEAAQGITSAPEEDQLTPASPVISNDDGKGGGSNGNKPEGEKTRLANNILPKSGLSTLTQPPASAPPYEGPPQILEVTSSGDALFSYAEDDDFSVPALALKQLPMSEVKNYLKKLNLTTRGSRTQLTQRLENALATSSHMQVAQISKSIFDDPHQNKLTDNEMRKELKRRGLPCMGNRRELIMRLRGAGMC
eukprot:gene23553-9077_t